MVQHGIALEIRLRGGERGGPHCDPTITFVVAPGVVALFVTVASFIVLIAAGVVVGEI